MDIAELSVDSDQPPPASPMVEPAGTVPLDQIGATGTPSPMSITVSSAIPADVPELAVLEMLAFVYDPTSLHLNPTRPVLIKSGVPPQKWPEYPSMLRRRHRSFTSGNMVFKATIHDADLGEPSGEKIVGFALMTPPRRLVSIKDRLWNSVLYPTYDRLHKFVQHEEEADGSDKVFGELFRDTVRRTREEIMDDREYFALNLLCTSTSYSRSGIGSSLLSHCTRFADAAHLPIILESTHMAISFYEKNGFRTVRTCKLEYMDDVIEWPAMVREPIGGYVSGGEAGEREVDVESLASET